MIDQYCYLPNSRIHRSALKNVSRFCSSLIYFLVNKYPGEILNQTILCDLTILDTKIHLPCSALLLSGIFSVVSWCVFIAGPSGIWVFLSIFVHLYFPPINNFVKIALCMIEVFLYCFKVAFIIDSKHGWFPPIPPPSKNREFLNFSGPN